MRCLACLATVFVLLGPEGSAFGDGELDTTFGNKGIVITDDGLLDSANAIAIQTDGKILVAGASIGTLGSDFALVRYDTHGQLDPSFGVGGKVITDFGGDEVANSVAIQADGRIVVVGTRTRAGSSDFAMARYNADGSLDGTLDIDGKKI